MTTTDLSPAICPWNFPLILSAGKIAPALMTGNCVVAKPSPFTPYTSLKFVELAQEILPPGVLSVVGGNNELGAAMCLHPDIAKISFTGSTATGKKVMETSAKTLKRVTLELGGNDASIILPDVDIKKIAPEVVMGAFQNSGQVCVATKRIFIHESIYKEFLAEIVSFTKTLKTGNPDDGDNMLGPVQNKMQYERVKGFFEDSKSKGYTFAAGEPDVAASKGYFIQPTIIDNPPDDSRIIQEEPFGPIVPTQPWSDLEEVIARANNTKSGLGACVWGADVEKASKIARRLEAGSVFVNSFEKPTPQAIFGGHKESGIGGEWGKTGLLAYCNPHVIHVYKS
jgi:acyl-CoA reductase-like NAD-dependent aldehyde dehydrogenase